MNTIDNCAPATAVPLSADNRKDFAAIASVIQTYAEGGRGGDAAIMKHAFRENDLYMRETVRFDQHNVLDFEFQRHEKIHELETLLLQSFDHCILTTTMTGFSPK